MAYPQDPHNPYGQPEQNPYAQNQAGQNPYGQPANPAPYGQPANPYDSAGGQPGVNPYDGSGGQPQQPYGQPAPGQFAQPGNPYDTAGGQPGMGGPYAGQPQQPYGQPQQFGAPQFQQGYPQQQPFYGGQQQPGANGGKNNNGMIIGIVGVVVVAVLAVGGYFAFSGNSGHDTPLVSPTLTGQVSASAADTGAPSGAPATGSAPNGPFNPPAGYSSNSLSDDTGCGDYASAAAAFLVSSLGISGSSAAGTALNTLAGSLKTASTDAQDPTLGSALSAEAAFVQQNAGTLTPPLVSYGSSYDPKPFVSAAQPIQATDTYINAVCGTASWIPAQD